MKSPSVAGVFTSLTCAGAMQLGASHNSLQASETTTPLTTADFTNIGKGWCLDAGGTRFSYDYTPTGDIEVCAAFCTNTANLVGMSHGAGDCVCYRGMTPVASADGNNHNGDNGWSCWTYTPITTTTVASSGSTGTPAYWDDMLHYIDFEGTTTDAKGNGVITDSNGNCDTLGSYVEGVSGPGSQAFHWDTTGWAGCAWLLTPNAGVSATEWSFSFWYKPDTTQSPGSPRLDWLYGAPSGSGINCYGCYHFTMNRNGDPDLEMYHYGPQMSSPTFNAGQWYNFFVSQGPSIFSLYVDGVLQQSVSKTAVAGDGVPISILVASGGGAIDDLIFYSKGFSDAEVATLGGSSPQARP